MVTSPARLASREIFILMASGLWAAAGCVGEGVRKVDAAGGGLDSMPAFAVSSKPHVGSLSVHSFAREGADDSPSPSPDGSWLVFVSTRNSEEPQLYRQPSTGSVVTQLTYGPSSHIQPRVSPDGREIAYAGNDSGSWDIWIMPSAGGSCENLTSTRDLDEVHPAWYPSGEVLAFSAYREKEERWWICAKSRGASGLSWIAPGLNPDWSPDGRRIVFQRAKGRGRGEYGIWTVEVTRDPSGLVAGGAQSQIVSDPAWSAVEPTFSPDGKRIAFVAVPVPKEKKAEDGAGAAEGERTPLGGDIWCVRVEGTDLVRLTATPEPDWNPAWAGAPGNPRENGRVFFASERDGHRNVWSLLPALLAPGPQ
jgi:Tol biopolymer transport system component